MNKAELVSHLSEKVGVTKKQAEDMVECFVDTVVETLDVVDRNVPREHRFGRSFAFARHHLRAAAHPVAAREWWTTMVARLTAAHPSIKSVASNRTVLS